MDQAARGSRPSTGTVLIEAPESPVLIFPVEPDPMRAAMFVDGLSKLIPFEVRWARSPRFPERLSPGRAPRRRTSNRRQSLRVSTRGWGAFLTSRMTIWSTHSINSNDIPPLPVLGRGGFLLGSASPLRGAAP